MTHQASKLAVAGTDATSSTGTSATLSLVPIEYFDEYVMVARLGQGGMAEVILGLSQGPNDFRKLVAIKRLHTHLHEDGDVVQMFQHEARLAARLHHPNVVQTHKVGFADGRHFMAMEYLEGQSLQRILRRLHERNARLHPVLAAQLISQALDGLHYAHEAADFDGTPLNIVHRDISPHNLFVTLAGQLKVLDFGIAKASNSQAFTRPGLIRGKLSYIAPEAARGQPVDRRADLWSMGTTLWEALSGTRLFRGDDVEVLRAVLIEELPMLGELDPHVPPGLVHIVRGALQREPHDRYDSALEMKAAIDGWLAEQAVAGLDRGVPSLADTMQSLFADAIRERQATLRACIAQLDAERELRQSAMPVEAMRSSLEAVSISRAEPKQQRLKLAAIMGAVAVAASVAIWVGRDDGSKAFAESAVRVQGPTERAEMAPSPSNLGAAMAAEQQLPVAASQPNHAVTARPAPRPSADRVQSPEVASSVASKRPRRATRVPAPELQPTDANALKANASAPVVPVPEARMPAEAAPASAAAERKVATGRLRLDSSPYAVVSLNGRRLGITPIDVELPASTHTLSLRNPERGIVTTYEVEIPEGQSVTRRIALE
ncbi:MAG: protein kinase [Myxococcales bacterium]